MGDVWDIVEGETRGFGHRLREYIKVKVVWKLGLDNNRLYKYRWGEVRLLVVLVFGLRVWDDWKEG